MTLSLRHKRVWIAGHHGMVGQSLMRHPSLRDSVLLTVDRSNLDLRHGEDTQRWVDAHQPDIVIMAAATVGGIAANMNRPAEFLYDNMMMSANVINAAAKANVQKLLYLGSSCIYPRDATQPIKDSSLLTGALEPSNEFYALAKIAGVKLCQSYRRQYGCDFISAMPCNLYGEGDRFDAANSHVIPALILKMENAKHDGAPSVTLWGNGTALREFLYIDDLANALIILLEHYDGEAPINIGSGKEISIAALARIIAARIGYGGEICFDMEGPDGVPRKVLDSTDMQALCWQPKVTLEDGIDRTIQWFRQHRVFRD